MKKLLLLLIISTIIWSCKNDKKVNESKTDSDIREEKVVENPNFTVRLLARVRQDDQFRILFTENIEEPFTSKQAVFREIKGSPEIQTIDFILKKPDIYPAKLRLNIGYNKNQEVVDIESVELLHENNSFLITDSILKQYFYPNKYIEFIDENGQIKFKKDDGKHRPFLVSRKPLLDVLANEF